MMNTMSVSNITAMSPHSIKIAEEAEAVIRTIEQIDMTTYHTLHGGVYSRTILLREGQILAGALIKIPTTLIVSGNLNIIIGDEVKTIHGTEVIAASAFRKQVMTAVEDTAITMLFTTTATSIEEAEDEFTDDSECLMSRLDTATNYINITGE